jgi:hypothetical protein
LRIHAALALLLTFYRDTASQNTLCLMFGIPPATLSTTLLKSEAALHASLKNYFPARICWPTHAEQIEWSDAVNSKETLVRKKWGFIDGKNFGVQTPSDSDEQNAFYNGWLHAHKVTGTICFGANGCIVWARHNAPGSWNDGETSRQFQAKLLNPILNADDEMGVLADTAFPVSGELCGKILTPLKDKDIERIDIRQRFNAVRMNNAILALRQAAEWGMGAIEKPFRRLILDLPWDRATRQVRLDNIFRLYNVRVRNLGISQISTVFMGTD